MAKKQAEPADSPAPAPPSAESDGLRESTLGVNPATVNSLTYEQARDELVEVVRRLENGEASLADSLALWERGEALAAQCRTWLDGAQARLDVSLSVDGGATDPSQPGSADAS
ncbi:MAG: exodeoxyribonuclease VII small subunit [Actinomycetota bacterium]